MRTAHDVAVELAPKNLRVPPHRSPRHGGAYIREQLMPIQAEELKTLAVEEESVHIESGLAKTDADAMIVHGCAADKQSGHDVIQMRRVRRPERDISETRERQPYSADACSHDFHLALDARDHASAILQFCSYASRFAWG